MNLLTKLLSVGQPGELVAARLVGGLLGLERWQKRALVLLSDMVLCALAAWLAFSIRYSVWMSWSTPLKAFTVVALCVFPTVFLFAGTYRHIFRFAGSGTIMQLASAIAMATFPMVLLFSVNQADGVPRTVTVLHSILFFLLAAVSRIVARYILADLIGAGSRAQGISRCLIYGAGTAGQQLQASIMHDPSMALVGFVDDDRRLHRQRLDGVPVYHSDHLAETIQSHSVRTVFIAIPNLSRSQRKEIIERLSGRDVQVQILPSVADVVEGRVSISDLREIRIEDLLGRDPVKPNELLLGRIVRHKTVLVTGAGGSIGSELCRQLLMAYPARLILAEMSEAALFRIDSELRGNENAEKCEIISELVNVADATQMTRLFKRFVPDTVFHAAAYKHVPLVEANAVSGMRNNILGTRNAAVAARDAETENFVLVSTDKAVRPTNVMGATKRVCELVLQAMAMRDGPTKFSMVRFGNVLGSSGSVVPYFQNQIEQGGPVTLTHRDITRFFMTIPEAAQLVIQAGAMSQGGEVFLLDMGEPVKIYDLARTMIELSGRSVQDEDNPDGDIAIVEIGLRPGEKLYEELLIGSNSKKTRHSQIMQAREFAWEPEELDPLIARLEDQLKIGDTAASLAILRQLVPEYERAEAEVSPTAAIR